MDAKQFSAFVLKARRCGVKYWKNYGGFVGVIIRINEQLVIGFLEISIIDLRNKPTVLTLYGELIFGESGCFIKVNPRQVTVVEITSAFPLDAALYGHSFLLK